MKLTHRILLVATVLFSCVGCDRTTKIIARHELAYSEPITFMNGMLRLQYAENPGAFLSLGAASPENIRFWIFTFVVGLVLLGMLAYLLISPGNSRARIVSLSLVLGGGIGNLIDRIFNQGRVIDFVNIGVGSLRSGVFNVADIAISVGVVWLCACSFNSTSRVSGIPGNH